jgi:hypothetical protein
MQIHESCDERQLATAQPVIHLARFRLYTVAILLQEWRTLRLVAYCATVQGTGHRAQGTGLIIWIECGKARCLRAYDYATQNAEVLNEEGKTALLSVRVS